MKSLNECFIQIRENLHLTQSEFAKKIGVSRSTIAKIENNEIEVSKKNIFNLWQNYPEQVEKYELLRKEIPKQHSYMNTLEVKKQVDVLISIYRKNIEDIEYFNNKIKSTVSMLKIFGTDLSDYNTLLDLLNTNLIELKETYNAYLVYSLLSNEELFKHPKIINEVSKVSNISKAEVEKVGQNILETYITTFDKIYDLLNLYLKTYFSEEK